MKRKIEFRGKCIDTGKWFFGNLFVNEEDNRCYIHYRYRDEDWRVVEVIPETVGQYTGLKDKNGEQIFEDDIVIDNNYPEDGIGYSAVRWIETVNHVGWEAYPWGIEKEYFTDFKVTSNIHENPELLK